MSVGSISSVITSHTLYRSPPLSWHAMVMCKRYIEVNGPDSLMPNRKEAFDQRDHL